MNVISQKISFKDVLQGTRKFLLMKAGRALFSVNLEVTRRCNARCSFCDYWQAKGQEHRLDDYAPVIRHLDPLHLTITGGEPLLRSDLEQIIRKIKEKATFVYMNMITNGSLLTVERALALWRAGLNQLSVSLDFPDERHDEQRGLPGLWRHLAEVLPQLARTEMDNLSLNTVIMRDNVDDLLDIARIAEEWGFRVSYSTYNPFKNENPDHLITLGQMKALEEMVEGLVLWKRKHRNITNSDFYLNNIPLYFRRGGIPDCLAGRKWVQVSPDGALRRCSDKELLGDWWEFKPNQVPLTPCMECWYACRGEAEAPLGVRRIVELNR
jgi:MoaA/NifB/PqqE/SkfB family radical SAM enzyme